MGDIAALITGGSSKDFTSVVTTGRFGTGFLVTHVLSERVQVSGVLEVDEEQRAFSIELDRPDDEKRILLNIEASENALAETSVVEDFESGPTATFEYEVDDDEIALMGLPMLEQALPHLFGTCPHLRSIHVVDEAGQPLRDAFAAIGLLVWLASKEGWRNAYRLAQLALPKEGLTETAVTVWREILSAEATKLAQLPIVNTAGDGLLPSVFSDGHQISADFIRGPLSGPTHAELWDLAATCTENAPPSKSDSDGWSEKAEGWEELGVQVHWIDLESIGQRASAEVREVSGLPIDGDRYRWLAQYLVAVGKTWRATGVTKHLLHNLVPDQNGLLRSAGELRRDGGVSERIKEIAGEVGLDFKAKLLSQELVEAFSPESLGKRLWSGTKAAGEATSADARASVPTLLEKGRGKKRSPFAFYAIQEATGEDLTEDEAVRELADHLSDALPDDQRLDDEDQGAVESTIALLEHVWSTQGEDAKEIVFGHPLVGRRWHPSQSWGLVGKWFCLSPHGQKPPALLRTRTQPIGCSRDRYAEDTLSEGRSPAWPKAPERKLGRDLASRNLLEMRTFSLAKR